MLNRSKIFATLLGLLLGAGGVSADMIEVNGADIYYESIGDGPAILMMHGGLGLSHDYLQPYFDILSQTHTVVYYDHFGNGRSAKPANYDEMNFDRLTSDAAELMSKLNHDTFTLVGHSYGGFIGQKFVEKYPDRLDGLVLISAVPAFDYQPAVSGTEEQMKAFGKIFSGPLNSNAEWQENWRKVMQMYFHNYDGNIGAALDTSTKYEYRAWNAAGPLLADFNMLEVLPKVTTPTLVMGGRYDPITPAEQGSERIAALIPNAELKIFENSAHYPFITEEKAFFETMQAWLKR